MNCCGKNQNLGFNLGLFFAGIYIVCGILLYLLPGLTMQIADYLVHGTIQFSIKPFNPTEFTLGVILWTLIGIAVGFAFSKLCECPKVEKHEN